MYSAEAQFCEKDSTITFKKRAPYPLTDTQKSAPLLPVLEVDGKRCYLSDMQLVEYELNSIIHSHKPRKMTPNPPLKTHRPQFISLPDHEKADRELGNILFAATPFTKDSTKSYTNDGTVELTRLPTIITANCLSNSFGLSISDQVCNPLATKAHPRISTVSQRASSCFEITAKQGGNVKTCFALQNTSTSSMTNRNSLEYLAHAQTSNTCDASASYSRKEVQMPFAFASSHMDNPKSEPEVELGFFSERAQSAVRLSDNACGARLHEDTASDYLVNTHLSVPTAELDLCSSDLSISQPSQKKETTGTPHQQRSASIQLSTGLQATPKSLPLVVHSYHPSKTLTKTSCTSSINVIPKRDSQIWKKIDTIDCSTMTVRDETSLLGMSQDLLISEIGSEMVSAIPKQQLGPVLKSQKQSRASSRLCTTRTDFSELADSSQCFHVPQHKICNVSINQQTINVIDKIDNKGRLDTSDARGLHLNIEPPTSTASTPRSTTSTGKADVGTVPSLPSNTGAEKSLVTSSHKEKPNIGSQETIDALPLEDDITIYQVTEDGVELKEESNDNQKTFVMCTDLEKSFNENKNDAVFLSPRTIRRKNYITDAYSNFGAFLAGVSDFIRDCSTSQIVELPGLLQNIPFKQNFSHPDSASTLINAPSLVRQARQRSKSSLQSRADNKEQLDAMSLLTSTTLCADTRSMPTHTDMPLEDAHAPEPQVSVPPCKSEATEATPRFNPRLVTLPSLSITHSDSLHREEPQAENLCISSGRSSKSSERAAKRSLYIPTLALTIPPQRSPSLPTTPHSTRPSHSSLLSSSDRRFEHNYNTLSDSFVKVPQPSLIHEQTSELTIHKSPSTSLNQAIEGPFESTLSGFRRGEKNDVVISTALKTLKLVRGSSSNTPRVPRRTLRKHAENNGKPSALPSLALSPAVSIFGFPSPSVPHRMQTNDAAVGYDATKLILTQSALENLEDMTTADLLAIRASAPFRGGAQQVFRIIT